MSRNQTNGLCAATRGSDTLCAPTATTCKCVTLRGWFYVVPYVVFGYMCKIAGCNIAMASADAPAGARPTPLDSATKLVPDTCLLFLLTTAYYTYHSRAPRDDELPDCGGALAR